MPKKFKQYKIATLRYLKRIIEDAELIADDVENIHEENGYMFAYLGSEVMIDGKIIGLRISIKKKISSNWFWIHNVDEKKFQITRPIHRMELSLEDPMTITIKSKPTPI